MSENFRGGGGGHTGGAGRMGGGGFSGGARMGSMPGRGFSAAGYAFPNRGQNISRGTALGGAGIMRNQNFSRPQGGINRSRHGNWNKDRRNWNRWNNNWWYGAAAVPFLGSYALNNYIDDNDYGDWYPGYSYYPDWGYDQEPNITNVYNIYNDKKQTSEEEAKKSDW